MCLPMLMDISNQHSVLHHRYTLSIPLWYGPYLIYQVTNHQNCAFDHGKISVILLVPDQQHGTRTVHQNQSPFWGL